MTYAMTYAVTYLRPLFGGHVRKDDGKSQGTEKHTANEDEQRPETEVPDAALDRTHSPFKLSTRTQVTDRGRAGPGR